MANQNALLAALGVAQYFQMHFGDQWAGGIEHFQATPLGIGLHRPGNTVGRKDDDDIIGDFIQLFDKHSAAGAQRFNHKAVMNHLMTNIDGRTKHIERAVNDIDRAVHAGTKATRISQFNLDGLCLLRTG